MVDGSGLENRRTRKGTGGSNPSLSASNLRFKADLFDRIACGDPSLCLNCGSVQDDAGE